MFEYEEKDLRLFALLMLTWMAFVAAVFGTALWMTGRYLGVW